MAQKTIGMIQAKQIQQLRNDGVPIKEIVRRTGISRKTIKKYLRKLEAGYPAEGIAQEEGLPDKDLCALLYNQDNPPVKDSRFEGLLRHFEQTQKELAKTGVTRQLLWMEYMAEYPDGYKYSRYCYLLSKYLKDSDAAFHWEYKPAEFIQVDFAGKKLHYVDSETGEVMECEVFVSVLPYSGLIFCMAIASQKTADFAHCINEMVKYIGGLTQTILCDNLKTAVTRADRYEPVFTQLCIQLGDHYHTTFSATRPASPTDKAMVEKSVNIIYNHIYGPLRKRICTSLEELNRCIREQLNLLNLKPYKGSPQSRRDIFTLREQSMLKPLPEAPYLVKKCRKATLSRSYYIQLPDNGHYYSIPYQYIGKELLIYFNQRTVEAYHQQERIAFHVRNSTEPKYNLIAGHMPKNHQAMIEMQGWTIEGLIQRAGWVGEYTRQAASRIINSSIYPEQNFKACNAMILLQKKYGKDRLEAACRRAANIERPTLSLIRNILQAGLDKQPLLFDEQQHRPLPEHENIRGTNYYQ